MLKPFCKANLKLNDKHKICIIWDFNSTQSRNPKISFFINLIEESWVYLFFRVFDNTQKLKLSHQVVILCYFHFGVRKIVFVESLDELLSYIKYLLEFRIFPDVFTDSFNEFRSTVLIIFYFLPGYCLSLGSYLLCYFFNYFSDLLV